jgi:hypothetical protein
MGVENVANERPERRRRNGDNTNEDGAKHVQ